MDNLSKNEQNLFDENREAINRLTQHLHMVFLKLLHKHLIENVGLLWIALAMHQKHPQVYVFSIKDDKDVENPLFKLNILMDMSNETSDAFNSALATTLVEVAFSNISFADVFGYLLETDLKNDVQQWYFDPIVEAYNYSLTPQVHIIAGRVSKIDVSLRMKSSKFINP